MKPDRKSWREPSGKIDADGRLQAAVGKLADRLKPIDQKGGWSLEWVCADKAVGRIAIHDSLGLDNLGRKAVDGADRFKNVHPDCVAAPSNLARLIETDRVLNDGAHPETDVRCKRAEAFRFPRVDDVGDQRSHRPV